MYEDIEKIPYTTNIRTEQRAEILAFLQGAMYYWCNRHYNEDTRDVADTLAKSRFAARDLVGGLNRNWEGTPLQCLYEKQVSTGKNPDEAFDQAAKEVGHYLSWLCEKDNATSKLSIKCPRTRTLGMAHRMTGNTNQTGRAQAIFFTTTGA